MKPGYWYVCEWMVSSDAGNMDGASHPTEEIARSVAARKAKQRPGNKYSVFKFVASVESAEVQWTDGYEAPPF